jgi:hypothetical protein
MLRVARLGRLMLMFARTGWSVQLMAAAGRRSYLMTLGAAEFALVSSTVLARMQSRGSPALRLEIRLSIGSTWVA